MLLALLAAIALTAVAYGFTYLPYYYLFPSLVPYTPDGEVDRAAEAAVKVGIGQVYTAFLGIFLAGLLGTFAIIEFKQNQERPALTLEFHDLSREDWRSENYRGLGPCHVALFNDGQAVARWFMVRLWIPVSSPGGLTVDFNDIHFADDSMVPKSRIRGTSSEVRMWSDGDTVSYPTAKMPFLHFPPRGQPGQTSELRWIIYSEKAKTSGKLTVVLGDTATASGPPQ